MALQDIEKEIVAGESSQLEFKKSASSLASVMKTLCGFLNNNGGKVLIGVKDNGDIVGIDVSDSTKKEIANLLSKFEPYHNVAIDYIAVPNSDKKIIALQVSPSENDKPYAFDGRYYYREQSSVRRMTQPHVKKVLLNKQNRSFTWDETLNSECDLDNLDTARILEILKRGINKNRIPATAITDNVDEALQRLGLSKNGHLTNAAIVLFAKNIMPVFIQCELKLAAFRDNTKRSFIDSKIFRGNLFDLLEAAEIFINHHTRVGSYFTESSLQRVDVPDYPPIAVREATINALCHRDYANKSGSVSISIFPDYLEIASFGRLPEGMNQADLLNEHSSVLRNPYIADVLYRTGFIEKYGTGIQEIIRLCTEAETQAPEFFEQSGFFVVRLHKSQSINELLKKHGHEEVDVEQFIEEYELSPRQSEILVILLRDGMLKNKQIMEKLKVKVSDRTLYADLKIMKDKDLISKQGLGKATSWKVDIGGNCAAP